MRLYQTYVILNIVFLLCILSEKVFSQDSPLSDNENKTKFCSFGIFYDQDYTLEMFGLKKLNEDRNYTMGLGLYYSSSSLSNKKLYIVHNAANKLFGNKKPFKLGPGLTQKPIYGFMIGDGAFTPDSLRAYGVIKNDRPYASLTYFQTVITNQNYKRYKNYISTLSIGLLGTAISREVQTFIHKKMNNGDTKNPYTPRGWGNQISNGGEPVIAYSFTKETLHTTNHINSLNPGHSKGIECKSGYTYSVGYYTYGAYEFDTRIGWFDARNWTYRVSPNGGADKNTFVSSKTKIDKPSELYFISSVRPMFMLYNALLNGQFKKNIHAVSFKDSRHFLLEYNAGIGGSFKICSNTALDFKIKFSARTPEFRLSGRKPRTHYWGGMDFIITHF